MILGQGGVPTKVAVGRDRDEAGVLLLLAPRLVGPVIQVCQVRRALRTELHPGRALPVIGSWSPKDEVVTVRGEGGSCALLTEPKLFMALGAPLTELPLPTIQLITDGQVLA